jgi:sugar lactone lactonase YvrE
LDTAHNKLGDGAAEIPTSQLAASGVASPVGINEPIFNQQVMGVTFNAGNLWVATMIPQVIYEFTQSQLQNLSANPNPTPVTTISSTSTFKFILGITFDNAGNLWVVDQAASAIDEFSTSQLASGGNLTPVVTISSTAFRDPAFALFDSSGNLWIANTDGNQIFEFAVASIGTSGSLLPTVVIQGPSVSEPGEMAFDQNGTLWVANSGNNTIAAFTKAQLASSGSPTATITLSSTSVGALLSINVPWGMAFDSQGSLCVSNYVDGTISKFGSEQLTASGTPAPDVFLTGLPLYGGEMTFGPASQ